MTLLHFLFENKHSKLKYAGLDCTRCGGSNNDIIMKTGLCFYSLSDSQPLWKSERETVNRLGGEEGQWGPQGSGGLVLVQGGGAHSLLM